MIYEYLADTDLSNAEPIQEESLIPDVENFESTDAYDQYILVSVMLQKNDGFYRALVMVRKRDFDGNIMGSCHSNPLLDTCVCGVQFQDGLISEYAANLIAENLYSQKYPDGNYFLLLNNILDLRSTDKDVKTEDDFKGDPAKRNYKKMTAG